MNTNDLERLNSFLDANFEPHLHYAVREFLTKWALSTSTLPNNYVKWWHGTALLSTMKSFFDDYLAYDYTHEFSCHDPGQYHKRDDLYVTVDHKYIVQQNIF